MTLHGREAELGAAEQAVRAAAGGESRALALIGEAGIGKSAVLAAIGERATADELLVLEGRSAEQERDVPFSLVIDALDEHVAGLHPRRVEAAAQELGAVLPSLADPVPAPAAPGAAERYRLHRALRALLELLARERPVVLLLDDLHWADDASVEFVLHLLRRPPRAGHLLAVALRPVDPLDRVLEAARGGGTVAMLTLGPLGDPAAHALVDDLLQGASGDRIVQAAGGNPLFLQELARAPGAPDGRLPATLIAAMRRETDRLPPASRAVIEGAAVAGDPFDPELAAAGAGLDPGDVAGLLDVLVAADLVRPGEDGRAFRFRHPLVRRAVYDAAPPAWRLSAHARVAEALASRRAAAPVRAYHVERCAQPGDEEAVALLAQAAAVSADTAPATAARWYAAALRLMPADDPSRRAGLLAPMALALAGAGRLAESREALLEVLALLPPEPTNERLSLVSACAAIEQQLGRHTEARRRLLDALEGAPPAAAAALELDLAAGAVWSGDHEAHRHWAQRAVASSAGVDDALLAGAEALVALSHAWTGAPDGLRDTLARATTRLAAVPDDQFARRLDAAVQVAFAQVLGDRFADAVATAERGLVLARRSGQGTPLVALEAALSMAWSCLGDLDRSLRHAEAAEEGARLQESRNGLQFALWMCATLYDLRAEPEQADRAAAECAELLAQLEPSNLTVSGACAIAGLLAERDPEEAIRRMVEAGGPLLERANPTWAPYQLLVLVRAAIAAGRLEDATRWAREATRRADKLGLATASARAACARGEVHLAQGEAGTAVELARAAAADAQRAGSRLDELPAHLLYGRALAAGDRPDEAVAVLENVVVQSGRDSALKLRDQATRELRNLGASVSASTRRAAAQGDVLTAREREVAALVARGHTNKQVAATLFLSQKTVEHHLSRAYDKLGIRSRTALVEALHPRAS